MAKKNRDDFTPKTKKALRERVSSRCSNPSCRVPTSAPSGDTEVNNIGEAAHICAAAPGGLRYDSKMTTEERTSIKNGLWLCANCAGKIDNDEEKYTVELLHEWKREAEKKAAEEQGKHLPDSEEVTGTLATALAGAPPKSLHNAIPFTHTAVSQALEFLDPRFNISTEYIDGKQQISVSAKETVAVNFKFQFNEKEKAEGFYEQFRQMMAYGTNTETDSVCVSVQGSELLERLFSTTDDGVLVIRTPHLKAIQKLCLFDEGSGIIEQIDDINCEVSGGTEGVSFDGSSFCGLLEFGFVQQRETGRAKITLGINLKKWEEIDLRALPYFSKTFSLFTKMAEGWVVKGTIEINGDTFGSFRCGKIRELERTQDIARNLYYIDRCRVVLSKLRKEVKFREGLAYTKTSFISIKNAAATFDGKFNFGKDRLTKNVTSEFMVNENYENVSFLKSIEKPANLKYIEDVHEELEIFDTKISLPRKIVELHSVLPKIVGEVDNLCEGDIFTVEWLPQEGFQCLTYYETGDSGEIGEG